MVTTVTAFSPRSRPVTVPAPSPAAVTVLGRRDGRIVTALSGLPRPPPDARRLVVVELGERFRTADNHALLRAVNVADRVRARAVLFHAGAGGGSLLGSAAEEVGGPHPAVVALPSGGTEPGAAVDAALALAASGRRRLDVTVDPTGEAWEIDWQRDPLPPARPRHRQGPVVVTGGLGGIGLRVAHLLARDLGTHPVLLDERSPGDLPDTERHRLLALLGEPAGATVCQVDLTVPEAVTAALAPFVHGGITGVIHCAGSLVAGEVATLAPADLARAQAGKVGGLGNVLTALDPHRLRYLVTFGSITATAPHRGLGAYALANELLTRETLRYGRQLPGCTTVAAQWSLWAGAGMAHELGAVEQARRMGMWPVPLGAGLDVVLRLLSLPTGVHSLVLVGGRDPRPDGTDGRSRDPRPDRMAPPVQRDAGTPFGEAPFRPRGERPVSIRSRR